MSFGEDTFFCASISMVIHNAHSLFNFPVEYACILQLVCFIYNMSIFIACIIYQYILVLLGNMFLYYTFSSAKGCRGGHLLGFLVCSLTKYE